MLKVRKLKSDNIEDQVSVCVPKEFRDKSEDLRIGYEEKLKWLDNFLKKTGSCADLCYENGKCMGFLEYVPSRYWKHIPDQDTVHRTIQINCAPPCDNLRIREFLLREKLKKPMCEFFDKNIESMETGTLKNAPVFQYEFYKKFGFKDKVEYEIEHAKGKKYVSVQVYYPLIKGISFKPKKKKVKNVHKAEKPVEFIVAKSAQCPFSISTWLKCNKVAKEFGNAVNFIAFDYEEQPELLKRYEMNWSFVLLNGHAPWLGPMKEEDIRKEIEKELKLKGE